MENSYQIRQIVESDVDGLARTFAAWHKYRPQFERYYHLHQLGKRIVLVVEAVGDIVGYVNLIWLTEYNPFRLADIPEIIDLNVITAHQRKGIGTALIATCEEIARANGKPAIGISVEQSQDYAAANLLYPQLGYVPDGNGITEHDNEIHLVKRLIKDQA